MVRDFHETFHRPFGPFVLFLLYLDDLCSYCRLLVCEITRAQDHAFYRSLYRSFFEYLSSYDPSDRRNDGPQSLVSVFCATIYREFFTPLFSMRYTSPFFLGGLELLNNIFKGIIIIIGLFLLMPALLMQMSILSTLSKYLKNWFIDSLLLKSTRI